MTFNEYQKIRAVNYSSLKHMRVSPKFYKWKLDNPGPTTRPMSIGSIIHSALLDKIPVESMCVEFDGDRRKKEYKEFAEQNKDKVILKPVEMYAINKMLESVYNHSDIKLFESTGDNEHVITWTDTVTELPCKVKIDRVIGTEIIVEIKTHRHATVRAFARDYATMGYALQAGMYQHAVMVERQKWLPSICFAIQSTPPYDCVCFDIPGRVLDHGNELFQTLLQKLKECIDTKSWPGISSDRMELPYPEWAYRTADDEEIALSIGGEEVTF